MNHEKTTGSGSAGHGAVNPSAGVDANQCGQAGPQRIRVTLASNAADVMRCLFFHGSTWDGNVPSKSGRDELVQMGLAERGEGWQWLTPAGMRVALDSGLHREKEQRESTERKRRNELRALATALSGAVLGEKRDFDIRLFLGYLSGEIPELRTVEVPRLADAWQNFRRDVLRCEVPQ